jgi:cytochrome P450
MKDFTFSDGTVVPKGTILTTASQATHLDNTFYENAEVFDPFRFAHMHDEGGDDAKHSYVSTNPGYLAFGHGKHAWYRWPLLSTSQSHDIFGIHSIAQVDSLPRPS